MRDLEIAFLAKITASMTHEIANSLAIILESAGLLSDILNLSQESDFPHREKFQRILRNINDQVKRGVDISERLNQFAHSMDEPVAEVNIPELLDRVVLLLRRLVRRRGIELAAAAHDQDLVIRSDPFRLQLVLASVIEQLTEVLTEGSGIILQAQGTPQEVTILVEAQGVQKVGLAERMTPLLATLQEVLEALPARLAVAAPPAAPGVVMTVSAAAPAC
jgi:C4-dicarboxylate-specific signal transduction histidine kinase|uniref:HAMP domain-containing histidine kinase n=1 Tax=Desulfobacca acetoxidans TaxID=60893 RepID=A0A7V6DP15_9BACT